MFTFFTDNSKVIFRTEGQELFSVTATVCVSWLSASQVTTGSIHLAISPHMSLNRIKPIINVVRVNI